MGWAAHHCAGFLHFQLLVHHGRAAAGHRDGEWGTGKVEPWAKELPRDGAAGAGYPDLRHPRWNRHGREETGGSYLRDSETGFRIPRLLYPGTADGTAAFVPRETSKGDLCVPLLPHRSPKM